MILYLLIKMTDNNEKRLVNASVGLLTIDEMKLSGGYNYTENKRKYLYKNINVEDINTTWRSMSPLGLYHKYARICTYNAIGSFN